jgi:hypothetical protein
VDRADNAKPSYGGDTLRRCVTVTPAVTDRGRRAFGWLLAVTDAAGRVAVG